MFFKPDSENTRRKQNWQRPKCRPFRENRRKQRKLPTSQHRTAKSKLIQCCVLLNTNVTNLYSSEGTLIKFTLVNISFETVYFPADRGQGTQQVLNTLLCFRISDLEMQVDRMRQQQDQLQKRLKDESDKKGRLEVSRPLCTSLLLCSLL